MRKTSEVENPSPGQKLGMAVPDRTISTLHLLSIPPQTWGRTLPNPAVAVLVYCFTQHQLAASFCFPPFSLFLLGFSPVDRPPQPHVGQVKLGGTIPGCSTAVPDSAGLGSAPARAALPALGHCSSPLYLTLISLEASSSTDTSAAAFRMHPRSNLITEEGFELH